MRRIGERQIWIGNAGDLRDPRSIMNAGVRAIVEVSYTEAFAELPRELVRLRFPMHDGDENATWLVRLAVRTAARLVRDGVPTIVCCSFGMNRSVCVAAGALALADKIPPDEALRLVATHGPADVSPALWAQVCEAVA